MMTRSFTIPVDFAANNAVDTPGQKIDAAHAGQNVVIRVRSAFP